MEIVFFGTPAYIIPVIEKLHATFKTKDKKSPIVAVVTQEPKKAGREKRLKYTSVDAWAHKKNIPIFYNGHELIKSGIKADLGILASYGAIIPKSVIDFFPMGILNIHPSLLPRWRGASPVQGAIFAQDEKTGVTIIKLDEKLDHGPIISSFKEEIKEKDTTESLRDRLFEKSASFLTELLPSYLSQKIKPKAQDESEKTFTSLIRKRDGFIPPEFIRKAMRKEKSSKKWTVDFIKDMEFPVEAKSLAAFVRAMDPWPMAWTKIKLRNLEKRLKIISAEEKEGKFILRTVQLEGKNLVSWEEFKRGYGKVTF